QVGADFGDVRMTDTDCLRYLPIGLRRRGLEQLGDQLPLLLGGEVPPVNVLADDEGDGIADIGTAVLMFAELELKASDKAGAIPIPAVANFALVEIDGLALPVLLDVGDQRVELLALHQREDVGERVEPEYVAAMSVGRFAIHCLPHRHQSGLRATFGVTRTIARRFSGRADDRPLIGGTWL